MENLMRAIDKILQDKNREIDLLIWEKESLEKMVMELKKEISELYIDIEKYRENEVNRYE